VGGVGREVCSVSGPAEKRKKTGEEEGTPARLFSEGKKAAVLFSSHRKLEKRKKTPTFAGPKRKKGKGGGGGEKEHASLSGDALVGMARTKGGRPLKKRKGESRSLTFFLPEGGNEGGEGGEGHQPRPSPPAEIEGGKGEGKKRRWLLIPSYL